MSPIPNVFSGEGAAEPEHQELPVPDEALTGKPIITSGTAGPGVVELCRRLAELGHETDVSRGLNPFAIYGPAEHAAVESFRADAEVEEDPEAFGGREEARAHVGPATWAALIEATG